jgi:hypothetical protein
VLTGGIVVGVNGERLPKDSIIFLNRLNARVP